MDVYRRRMIAAILAALLAALMAGCGSRSADAFKKLTGDWASGLLFPETSSNTVEPSLNSTYLIAAKIVEDGVNAGTLSIYDRSGDEIRGVNFSPSMTHSLYDLPFVYDPDSETLQGEVTARNEDGSSERTTISLIAFEMDDGSNSIMNGTIEMELFDGDGNSLWLTTCTINAYKEEVKDV